MFKGHMYVKIIVQSNVLFIIHTFVNHESKVVANNICNFYYTYLLWQHYYTFETLLMWKNL